MAYVDQSKKALIAAALKPVMPVGWKWSLAVQNHSTIVLTIASAPINLLAEVLRVVNERAERRGDRQFDSKPLKQAGMLSGRGLVASGA